MPLLKPTLVDDAMSAALTEAGLLAPRRSSEKDVLKEALRKNGLSLEDCITELRSQMCDAQKEETRAKLLETALKMNGAMKDDTTREAPAISFVIQGNVQLNSILAPQRD